MPRPGPLLRVLTIGAFAALVACPLDAAADEAKPKSVAADEEQRERARTLFAEGREQLANGDLAAALAAFRESHEVVPSPNSRLMAARTLQRMGRLGQAWAEYEAVVADAKRAAGEDEKYVATLRSAEDERAALKSKIGMLSLDIRGTLASGSVVLVDDAVVASKDSKRPIAVAPGTVRVVVVSPSAGRVEASVEVVAGGTHEVALEIPSAAPPCAEAPSDDDDASGTLTVLAIVSGGLGIAGFGLLGVVAVTQGSDALAATGISVGTFGIGMGATLYAVAWSLDDDEDDTARAAVVVGPGSVGVVGAF